MRLLRLAPLLLMAACGPKPGRVAPRGSQVETFEHAWSRVAALAPDATDDGHIGRVDWVAARAALLPEAEAARSPAELRPVLRQLLGQLERSHYAVVPRTGMARVVTKAPGPPGDLGFDVLPLEDEAVIWRLSPDTPAERLLGAGERIVQFGSLDLDALVTRLREGHPADAEARAHQLWAQTLAPVAEGQVVPLVVEDLEGQARTVSVEAGPLKASLGSVGNLPPQPVEIQRSTTEDGVEIYGFSVFLLPALQGFEQAVADARSNAAPGLVLDLRGNTGGVVQLARGFAGWLLDEPSTLGTMTLGTTPLSLKVHPRPEVQRYRGPVAVLVDGRTMSTGEVLTAGLQELGRARVFGEQTPGRCLPSFIETLPNGDLLQLAFGDLTTPTGRRLEGTGVDPDAPVAVTRSALSNGEDPVLEAALAWIATQTETP